MQLYLNLNNHSNSIIDFYNMIIYPDIITMYTIVMAASVIVEF